MKISITKRLLPLSDYILGDMVMKSETRPSIGSHFSRSEVGEPFSQKGNGGFRFGVQ